MLNYPYSLAAKKQLVTTALEKHIAPHDVAVVDNLHLRVAYGLSPEFLEYLLDAQVDYISGSDVIGNKSTSRTTVNSMLEFTKKHPDCFFNGVAIYDDHKNLLELTVSILVCAPESPAKMVKALKKVIPPKSKIEIQGGSFVIATMDDRMALRRF